MDEGQETQNWTETLEGEQFTPEIKQSLSTKFKTQEDLAVNYLDLEKQVRGKPFRLPESLDKLPDDKTRTEFTTSVSKLLGAVEKPDDLKDINWTVGMTGEKPVADAGLVKGLTEFAIANHWPKANVQKGIEFWNNAMAQAGQQHAIADKESRDKVHGELVAKLGTPEKVAEASTLVDRFFQNRPGMTPEKYEQIGVDLKNSFIKNSTLTLELMAIASELQGEGTTDIGKGGIPPPKPPETNLQPTYKVLGWKE